MKFLKNKVTQSKAKVRNTARKMLMMGWVTMGKSKVDAEYKKFFTEADKVLGGEIDYKTHKYWEGKILNGAFGKNVSGSLAGEAAEIKEWLYDYVGRLRIMNITDDDRETLRDKLIPFMKKQQKSNVDFSCFLDNWKLGGFEDE